MTHIPVNGIKYILKLILVIIFLLHSKYNNAFSQNMKVFDLLQKQLPCTKIDSLYAAKFTTWERISGMYLNSGCYQENHFLNLRHAKLEFPQKEEILLTLKNKKKIKLNTKNVFEVIAKKANQESFFMINESHTNPNHRKFIETLLPYLYDVGYRNIGMEALSNFDEASNNLLFDEEMPLRGAPIIGGRSGSFYLNAPVMSNIIRTGLELGFNFFGYASRNKNRELGQAKNILKKTKGLEGKTLIICGYWHLLEKPFNEKKWLASILKDSLGQDIYTIDQTFFNFHPDKSHSQVYFKVDNDKNTPSLVSAEKKNKLMYEYVDDFIFHPFPMFFQNKPLWNYDKNYHFLALNKIMDEKMYDSLLGKTLKVYKIDDLEIKI